MSDQHESGFSLTGAIQKEMISERRILRRYLLSTKPELLKLLDDDLRALQNAGAISGKAVNGYQPLEESKSFRKMCLQRHASWSKDSIHGSSCPTPDKQQLPLGGSSPLRGPQRAIQSTLAPIGAIFVDDSPLGGFVERRRSVCILRLNFIEPASGKSGAKFLLPGFQSTGDAGVV